MTVYAFVLLTDEAWLLQLNNLQGEEQEVLLLQYPQAGFRFQLCTLTDSPRSARSTEKKKSKLLSPQETKLGTHSISNYFHLQINYSLAFPVGKYFERCMKVISGDGTPAHSSKEPATGEEERLLSKYFKGKEETNLST